MTSKVVGRTSLPIVFLVGGIAAVVASITLTATQVIELRNATIAWSEKDLAAHALMLGESVLQMTRASDAILKSVADDVARGSPSDDESYRKIFSDRATFERLEARAQTLPSLDVVTIVDINGRVVNFSRSYPAPEINLSDRDYFKAHRAGTGIAREVSVPVQNRGTGTWVFYQSRAILTESRNIIGLVLVGLSQTYFNSLIQQSNGDLDTRAAIFRADGVFLAGDAGLELSSVNPRNVTEGRDRSIVVQNVLRDLPITIVVAKPETAALREWKSIALLQANEAIVFSAIILIAISIVYRILRMQERLIAELADAREQAQAASSYKSTFLANMSHELRTPLNAIIGFSEIINKEILGKISQPKYVEYSSDIHSAGSHLLELINEILDFSKIESGKLELSESVVDLHHVIERSIRLLRERADSKDVKITYHEPREVIAIKCDELRMRQVLLNLMANAIKFTPNGGTVSIDVDATVNGISVAISDTGVGMTEEEVAQALQPFVQIKRLSLSKGEGTGLGLPIAIRLVELHGGLLKIQSKLAVGTTAQIRLPKWRVVGSAE